MKKNLFLIILFYVFLKPSISFSLVEIDITRGNLDPMPISVTTEYSIQMQYKDCWSPPMGAEYKKNNYLVTVKLDLEKNGRVKSREILERNRMGTDSKYRIFAEAVDRAILKCNPIRNLPPKTYENWSTMILRFNPEGMMVGE